MERRRSDVLHQRGELDKLEGGKLDEREHHRGFG